MAKTKQGSRHSICDYRVVKYERIDYLCKRNMTKEELQKIIAIDEGFRIELTTSTGNMDKFQEAICAFANDMPGSGKKGYLLIGVYDDGKISGMKVDDALMKRISGIRSDGNILPLPVMTTEKTQADEEAS